MEISNNRIKVTSMKTFAKFFLHFSLVMLSCLTTGCTSEVETIGACKGKCFSWLLKTF